MPGEEIGWKRRIKKKVFTKRQQSYLRSREQSLAKARLKRRRKIQHQRTGWEFSLK